MGMMIEEVLDDPLSEPVIGKGGGKKKKRRRRALVPNCIGPFCSRSSGTNAKSGSDGRARLVQLSAVRLSIEDQLPITVFGLPEQQWPWNSSLKCTPRRKCSTGGSCTGSPSTTTLPPTIAATNSTPSPAYHATSSNTIPSIGCASTSVSSAHPTPAATTCPPVAPLSPALLPKIARFVHGKVVGKKELVRRIVKRYGDTTVTRAQAEQALATVADRIKGRDGAVWRVKQTVMKDWGKGGQGDEGPPLLARAGVGDDFDDFEY